jgi:dihydropyrimidinase
VLPGFIDPHVHAYLRLPGTRAKSDYVNCTRAALMGGTTCIMDFAGSGMEENLSESWALWRRQAEGHASCDYLWHMTVTRFNDEIRRELERLVAGGLKSIKVYLAYKPTLAISDVDLFQVLEFAAAHDVVVMAHCENADLIPFFQQRLLAEGKTGPEWQEPSRPAFVEAEGVARFLTLASAVGAKAYVVHVSCAQALAVTEAFRGKMRDLYVETMIHYLCLDQSYAERPGFEGAKWVLAPPLREKANQAVLWAALADGRVDTLGSDHCPFDFKGQKERGRGDFTKIPNGIGGVEERVALAYTEGVCTGRLSLERLVEVASTAPARIFGLYPQKGTLQEGSDADLVVWNPQTKQILSQRTQSLDTDYNPYEGKVVRGAPDVVMLRGEVMVRNGQFIGTPGRGRHL